MLRGFEKYDIFAPANAANAKNLQGKVPDKIDDRGDARQATAPQKANTAATVTAVAAGQATQAPPKPAEKRPQNDNRPASREPEPKINGKPKSEVLKAEKARGTSAVSAADPAERQRKVDAAKQVQEDLAKTEALFKDTSLPRPAPGRGRLVDFQA